jgi:hypothetical protein
MGSGGQIFCIEFLQRLSYVRAMTRPLRIEYPGAVYHVTSRGNEKKAVERYAYRQGEIARHLSLHVSTVSTILRVSVRG